MYAPCSVQRALQRLDPLAGAADADVCSAGREDGKLAVRELEDHEFLGGDDAGTLPRLFAPWFAPASASPHSLTAANGRRTAGFPVITPHAYLGEAVRIPYPLRSRCRQVAFLERE